MEYYAYILIKFAIWICISLKPNNYNRYLQETKQGPQLTSIAKSPHINQSKCHRLKYCQNYQPII